MSDAEEKNGSTTCGVGRFRPNALQCCANLVAFTAFFSPSALVGAALNTYMASQLTTIEKFFGLSSSASGFIMGCNDIGFLLTVLIFSYLARRVHIPRALALAQVGFGISAFLCSMSYFLAPKNNVLHLNNSSIDDSQLCLNDVNNTRGDCENERVGAPSSFSNTAMAIISLGMIIQGAAKSPRQSYITTYIDDNTKKQNTSRFLGFIMGTAIVGPSIGFLTGAAFSKMYVTLQDVSIGIKHPQWIGAWWLGFLVFGTIVFFTAIPLTYFPKRLKSGKSEDEYTKERKKLQMLEPSGKQPVVTQFLRLFQNGRYMGMLIISCVTVFAVGGCQSYVPKYIATQFSLPTWKANILMGTITTLLTAIGSFTGGQIISFLKFTPITIIKYIVSVNVIVVMMPLAQIFLGCPTPSIVGHNAPRATLIFNTTMNVSSICDYDCHCNDKEYAPICGSDGLTYLTPCIAGCTGKDEDAFFDCSCIGGNGTATPGLCDSECSSVPLFLVAMGISAFFRATTLVPSLIFSIRCVPDSDKSIAVGMASFCQALLGWLPGPIIFGMVIDTCCDKWNYNCDGVKGSCALYDNDDFRFKLYTMVIVAKFVVLVGAFVTFLISRNRTDWSTGPEDRKIDPLEEDTLMVEKLTANDSEMKPLEE